MCIRDRFEIADTATILRDGKRVATLPMDELNHDKMIELMIGQNLEKRQQISRDFESSEKGLKVTSLSGGTLAGIDLHVEPGEIVGVAGIMGSGREMLVPLITGQTPSDAGYVAIDNTEIQNYSPKSAIDAGMAFLAADRYVQGVIAIQSVRTNLTLSDVGRNWNSFRLDHKAEQKESEEWIEKLDVKTPTSETPIGSLSGGNQQKVLFARSLRLNPSVLVLDEPTRGIDVGAKEEIHQLVDQASRDNTAVLVVSTDTDELVRLSHRVLVMANGVISEQLIGDSMTVEKIEKAQLQSHEQMKAGAHGNT